MRIRQATLADLDALVDGNQRLAMETEALQLPTDTLSAGVTTLLTHPEYGHYWVAEDSGVICGQLMITFEWSDWRNGLLWWLQSVYVWPNMRQQGVFSALLTQVMDDAKRIGIPEIRLYAEVANTVAHRAYAQHGFTTGHYGVHCKVLTPTF